MNKILTCNLNGNCINCADGRYTKDQFKSWSSKNILRCPVCNGAYEYCHGRVAAPYFRHKDKTMCAEIYSEPETEEHKAGKVILYEWALKQHNLTNVVLEGWIQGTRQRPDLMFQYNGTQYVIEFQCSPICSEFYERHELYQAGGIIDIWITGTSRYNFHSVNRRGFTIEKSAIASLDVSTKKLNFSNFHMKAAFPEAGGYVCSLPRTYLLDHCDFRAGIIAVNPDYISDSLSLAIAKQKRQEEAFNTSMKLRETILSTLEEIKEKYGFNITSTSSPYYVAKIEFENGCVGFIKENKIDFCVLDFGRIPQYGFSCKKNRSVITGYQNRFYHRNIKSEKFNHVDRNCLVYSIEKFCSQDGGNA